jgi:hypothetical protein
VVCRSTVRGLRRYGFAIGVCALLVYAFPYYPAIRSANELPRVYLVQAIVEHGTITLDHVPKPLHTVDMSPSGGHVYSNKAPGSSFLAIPGYLGLEAVKAVTGGEPTLGEVMWICRITTGVIPTLAFLLLLWRFLGRFAPDVAVRRQAVIAYALGSMAMTYSILFIAHQLSAVCIASAWILAYEVAARDRDVRWMAVAGFLAGAAPLCDYQAAFAALPVAALLAVRLWPRPDRWRAFGLAIAGAAIPIAALLLYHDAAFGSPFRTGYDASTTFAHHHQQGFLGLTGPRWDAFVGSTVAPDNGLLVFSPWLLLAIPGTVLMWRRGGAAKDVAIVGAAVALIYVAFISSIEMWRGGWQMGPRYITVMLPFVIPAVAVALAEADRRGALWRGAALGLVGVGVVVYALAAIEFPHFPERFPNPIYEVTFRLITDGLAAPNLGNAIGLPPTASLLPYLAILVAVVAVAWVPARDRLVSAAIAIGVTIAIVAAYAAFPRGGADDDIAYRNHVAGAMKR